MFSAIAGLALALAASAVASGSKRTTIKLRQTNRGQLLVNRRGFTLYVFARDKRGKDVCVKIGGCPTVWPAVTTKGSPVAGKGIKAKLLGTIKLPNGKKQVTYAGWPLYTYIADSSPGQTSYIGVNQSGGRWYAISGAGKLVK